MNILSIDFDYFQKVTKQQLSLYPDGVDINTELSEIVWGNRYTDSHYSLFEIGINAYELKLLKKIICNQNESAHVMIVNSHRHIYDFIHNLISDDDNLSIVNVDMHHDFFNENPEIDCGNWIGFLLNEQQKLGKTVRLKWVANPVGLKAYGFTDEETQCVINTSLNDITHESFDAVFLCRSDAWTPPHLDSYFTELCDLMTSHFYEVCMEQNINKPRHKYTDVIKAINQLKQDMPIEKT